MGTGINCSYTNSSGVFVSLLCQSNDCCDGTAHTCSPSNCSSSSGVSLNTYLFWVILAGSALLTVLILVVSYAICRYRKPGCADVGAARDRFLEENILAATLGRPGLGSTSTPASSPTSSTPATSSSPSAASPDLLVHKTRARATTTNNNHHHHHHHALSRSMIPVKKPSRAAVNKAFIMGAEAFAGKPIIVTARGRGRGGGGAGAGAGGRGGRGGGVRVARGAPGLSSQRVQRCDVGVSSAGVGAGVVASPRMVQLGGFTPRVRLRERGRTESKQTIISSSDTDSMTAVGT